MRQDKLTGDLRWFSAAEALDSLEVWVNMLGGLHIALTQTQLHGVEIKGPATIGQL